MAGRAASDRQFNERLWSRVESTPLGCWIWTGTKNECGYGQIWVNAEKRRPVVHRLVYERLVGPIPAGMELDHLCRVRACCNPAHLEPVTHQENVTRGSSWVARNAAKTHCPYGHEFTPENTYRNGGSRFCRTCRRLRRRQYRRPSAPDPRPAAAQARVAAHKAARSS